LAESVAAVRAAGRGRLDLGWVVIGLWLGLDRLNIAKHGRSTGLAAIGREARGLGVGEGGPALGSALTETSHGK
jgi:hypothetical protein